MAAEPWEQTPWTSTPWTDESNSTGSANPSYNQPGVLWLRGTQGLAASSDTVWEFLNRFLFPSD